MIVRPVRTYSVVGRDPDKRVDILFLDRFSHIIVMGRKHVTKGQHEKVCRRVNQEYRETTSLRTPDQ